MTAEVLTRPLNLLARYELACIRPAKKHIYGTRRPLAISSHTTQRIIPDFLLPAFATGINLGSPLFHVSSTLHKRAVSHAKHVEQRREFSASPATKAVVVAANPRRDEDGNEMLIDITARAANRLKEIMSKDSNPNLALRVTVESGGCHGFQYLMSLTNTSIISPNDDTIFEAGDGSGAKVVMDEPSLELLKGSKVDFTMELIGSQFKIVGNPAASSSCGCGTSFDIKP